MNGQYNEAWIVNYFYTRNEPQLRLSDKYNSTIVEEVPYEQSLSKYSDTVLPYPYSEEKGAIEFVGDRDGDGVGDGTGWYYDTNFTVPFSFDINMGDANIQAYAKWEPCYYNISVYLDSEKTIELKQASLAFGSDVKEFEPNYSEEQAKIDAYKELIFAGWYYKDPNDNNKEKRFDFNTMLIKHDIEIYAKWTSKFPLTYTIHYVTKDPNGTIELNEEKYVEIADPSQGASLEGITKSFVAKVGGELYTDYQTGYFPRNRSHSITMSRDKENVYYFEYVGPADNPNLSYTITHEFVSEAFIQILNTNTITLTQTITVPNEELQDTSAIKTVTFQEGVSKSAVISAAQPPGTAAMALVWACPWCGPLPLFTAERS